MGRRKRRKDNVRERDTSVIASPNLLTRTVYSLLSDIEDRRLYEPSRVPRAKGLSKKAARVELAPMSRPSKSIGGYYAPDVFRFNKPKNVAVCVRRQRRKEVLFALKRTGKGSRSRRKRGPFTMVSCK